MKRHSGIWVRKKRKQPTKAKVTSYGRVRVPLKGACTLKLFYAENCSKTRLKLKKWLDVEKWQNWPFCKSHPDQRRFILSRNFLNRAKDIKKMTALFYTKIGIKTQLIFNIKKWQKWLTYSKMVKNGLFWGGPLRCKKRLYNHMTVILHKKRLNTNLIIEKRHLWKVAKLAFCKGYTKAKSSKLTYLVTEFQKSKIIQKMTLNTHKGCFMGKRTEKHLVFEKWHHFENWPFCKGMYNKAKWSIVVYFGSELERAKTIQKRLCNHITVLLCKNWPKNTLNNVRQVTRFWKVTKMAILLNSIVRRRGQNENGLFGSELQSFKTWDLRLNLYL